MNAELHKLNGDRAVQSLLGREILQEKVVIKVVQCLALYLACCNSQIDQELPVLGTLIRERAGFLPDSSAGSVFGAEVTSQLIGNRLQAADMRVGSMSLTGVVGAALLLCVLTNREGWFNLRHPGLERLLTNMQNDGGGALEQ